MPISYLESIILAIIVICIDTQTKSLLNIAISLICFNYSRDKNFDLPITSEILHR